MAPQVLQRQRYFLPALLILVLSQIVTSAWLTDVAARTPAARSAAPSAALRDKVQVRLNQLHDADGFPGATASVILPDSSEILAATGVSNQETKSAMRPEDRMLAGSIGKTFFAVIFLRMVGDHQMELDQKISTWLRKEEWFHRLPNANDITLRMLLNHTSGIPEYAELPTFTEALWKDPQRTWTPVELLLFIFDKPALFPAGKGWSYADANFLVAGLIAEKILGKPLYGEVQRGILDPLHLENTLPSISPVLPGLVTGYSMPNSPFRFEGPNQKDGKLVFNPQFEWTGGGFLSSSSDLAHWSFALYGGDVLRPDLLKLMEAGVPAKTGKDDEYGLGVQIRHTKFGVTYGHGGWFPGYLSEMEYFPEYHAAFAVQINTDDLRKTKGIPHRDILELAQVVLPEIPNQVIH